jgi:malic enzyme
VFIGLSAPHILTGADVATMSEDAIVFALANPDPEVDPDEAAQPAPDQLPGARLCPAGPGQART